MRYLDKLKLYAVLALICTGTFLMLPASAETDIATLNARIEADKKDLDAHKQLVRTYLAQADMASGVAAINDALKVAKQTQDKLDLYALAIRFDNLTEVRKGYRNALQRYKAAKRMRGGAEHAELNLAMSLAYLRKQNIEKAKETIEAAMLQDSPVKGEAEAVYKQLQMLEKAVIGEQTLHPLAFSTQITRAQLATLLIEEVAIDAMLEAGAGRDGETSDQGLTDYQDHPAADSILAVSRLGIRSLRIRNGKFDPEKSLTRLELALVLEDVLFLKLGVNRTQFIGTASPFKDLSSSSTGFNAVMTAVTRGLMQGQQDGNIRPEGLVSGAETVLVLNSLRKNIAA